MWDVFVRIELPGHETGGQIGVVEDFTAEPCRVRHAGKFGRFEYYDKKYLRRLPSPLAPGQNINEFYLPPEVVANDLKRRQKRALKSTARSKPKKRKHIRNAKVKYILTVEQLKKKYSWVQPTPLRKAFNEELTRQKAPYLVLSLGSDASLLLAWTVADIFGRILAKSGLSAMKTANFRPDENGAFPRFKTIPIEADDIYDGEQSYRADGRRKWRNEAKFALDIEIPPFKVFKPKHCLNYRSSIFTQTATIDAVHHMQLPGRQNWFKLDWERKKYVAHPDGKQQVRIPYGTAGRNDTALDALRNVGLCFIPVCVQNTIEYFQDTYAGLDLTKTLAARKLDEKHFKAKTGSYGISKDDMYHGLCRAVKDFFGTMSTINPDLIYWYSEDLIENHTQTSSYKGVLTVS